MKVSWLWALAGIGASAILSRVDFSVESDALSGSLAVLPAVLGLFLAADAIRPKPDAPRDPYLTIRVAGLGVLLLLALGCNELGLRFGSGLGAQIVFTGLLVLLFWQAIASLAEVARATPRKRRERISFFLIVLAVYLALIPWQHENRPPDGDEPYYLLMAHSLAYDFDVDLTNNYEAGDSTAFMPRRIRPQVGDPVGPNNELYSRHNMFLALVLAPAYRLFGVMGALALMALMTAALAWVVLLLADVYFPEHPTASLWSASIFALSPPLLLYSYQVWAEVPAALLTTLAIYALFSLERQPSGDSNALPKLLVVAALILLLPLLKLRFLILSASLLGLALLRAPTRIRALLLRLGIGLLALTAVALLFNQTVFGHALKNHSWRSLASYFTAPSDYLGAPFGLFFDSAFGLFLTSPVWLLLIPGLWLSARRRPRVVVDMLVVCLLYLVLLGPRTYWYGGWSPPFRYGLVFLPLLSLLLIPVLSRRDRRGVRFLLGFLLAATAVLTIVWVAVPGWTYNFADGRGHLLDQLSSTFEADVARFFPSQIRPRTANLVWLAGLLALLPAVARIRRIASPATAAGGVAALIGCLALLPLIAVRLPVETVEFEDPYVVKTGGEPWPEQWTPFRPAYRGAWRLRSGDEVSFELAPEGGNLSLAIDLRRQGPPRRPVSLQLLAGVEEIATIQVPPTRQWSTLEVGPFEWPPGERRLGFRFVTKRPARLLLDRVDLDWSD